MGKKAAFWGDDERTRALIAAGGKGELTYGKGRSPLRKNERQLPYVYI